MARGGVTFSFLVSWLALGLLGGCSLNSNDKEARNQSFGPGSQAFQQMRAAILVPKCSRCHPNAAQGEAGFGVGSYSDVMGSGFVHAGQASRSQMCLVVYQRQMPPDGTSLTNSEINTICSWIQSGAK